MICAMIYTARRLHIDNPVLGDEGLAQPVRSIMGGGEGLHIQTPFDDD